MGRSQLLGANPQLAAPHALAFLQVTPHPCTLHLARSPQLAMSVTSAGHIGHVSSRLATAVTRAGYVGFLCWYKLRLSVLAMLFGPTPPPTQPHKTPQTPPPPPTFGRPNYPHI
jgi:hypothetical protein